MDRVGVASLRRSLSVSLSTQHKDSICEHNIQKSFLLVTSLLILTLLADWQRYLATLHASVRSAPCRGLFSFFASLILVVAGLSCSRHTSCSWLRSAGRISPSLPLVIIRRWPHGICRDTCDLRRTHIQQPWNVDYVRHPTKYRLPAVIQSTSNACTEEWHKSPATCTKYPTYLLVQSTEHTIPDTASMIPSRR
ncbi:hypothetical protein J3F84DRAFT_109972 [Trichoderma pleuroticola]